MKKKITKYNYSFVLMLLGVTAIAIMWGMDVIRMIDWEIPNEIREGANIAVAEALAHGNNPFVYLENLQGMPNVYYMYPIFNNLIASLFVRAFGLPAGLVLLLLNFLYTTLTAVVIATVTKHYVKNKYLVMLSFLMSHYCGWRYTNVSAFPDMLAVFMLVMIMYICTVKDEHIRNKEIIQLSVLTVLLFFTKQYAIVTAIPIIVYLSLKKEKSKCLKYIVFAAILGMISVAIVYFCMPLYFVETLLLVGNSADNDFRWSITQFVKIGKLFFPWFALILSWLFLEFKKRRKIDFVVINFTLMAVMLLYFGQNTGAHLSYHLQLWLPSIIVLGIRALDSLADVVNTKYQNVIWNFLIGFVALVAAVYPFYWLHTPQLSGEQKNNWRRLYEVADQSGNPLMTSQNANYAILNGQYIYDCGQNQYILRNEALELWDKIENSQMIKVLFPNAMELKQSHENYRKEIINGLSHKEYDTLLLVDNFGFTRDWNEFQQTKDQCYELVEEIPVETGVWKWNVGIWKTRE